MRTSEYAISTRVTREGESAEKIPDTASTTTNSGRKVMETVATSPKSLESYQNVAGKGAIAELHQLSENLQGLRVLQINSTPVGGGVAEILQSQIPLMKDLGIDVEWRTISGGPEFFEITKSIHNSLQGHAGGLSPEQEQLYLENQQENAARLREEFDVVVVHDPQPLGIRQHFNGDENVWIWRLHIDSSTPNQRVWSFLRPFVQDYDAAIFTMEQFVPFDFPLDNVHIVPPAIDPITPKNRPMSHRHAISVLRELDIDPLRPLISQVARLDRWKDPWGVIDAYRIMRESIPELQLVLLGVIAAKDDPEAYDVYEQVRAYADDDPDIHIFVDPDVIGPQEVSAIQLASQVVFQKSIREGFGLSVSEALWKATPVIGGLAGGIPLQISDGEGGFLVENSEDAAKRGVWLLNHTPQARVIGAQGWRRVRERFLITRLIADELRLYHELLGLQTPNVSAPPASADIWGDVQRIL
jgi:trehalose synthase